MTAPHDSLRLPDPPARADVAYGSGCLAGVRVLMVSHGFQPNYERGFANGLAANGAQVTLVCSDRTDLSKLLPSIEALNLRGSQDSARPAASKALNMARYHLRLLGLTLRRAGWTVHVTGLLMPVVWCGLVQGLCFRTFAKRYVLTIHNVVPHDRHTWLNRRLHTLAYRLPHALVVHTTAMKQQLVDELRVAPERVVVMEHGIEPIGRADAVLPIARLPGPLRLLFFGALLHYKGLDILLTALAQDVPEFRLQIAGPCVDEGLVRATEATIAAHPRRAAIEWTPGFIPEREVPAFFVNADVLVLPYRHIDQSGVLFQAFRYGLPVIASNVGSFSHYVTDDVGAIFEHGNPDALADALRKFGGEPTRFSRAAIRDLGRRFEWPQVTKALSGVYGVSSATQGD